MVGLLLAALAQLGCAPEASPPTPQAAASAETVASLISPEARVGPRGGWRRVTVDNPDVVSAFLDAGTVTREG
ncbi:MAG TPA: hypothetical protein VD970_04850, partial [Acetobacteraceae bacterium]|nr:hypothetical protein [Acetobacteraceae bacterium]